MLCGNAARRLDDFLEWDMIGASIGPYQGGTGFNSGLSLGNQSGIEGCKAF
jgi:hypothetical protein